MQIYLELILKTNNWEKMAVPKRKTSVSKRNMRRSHDSLKNINITPIVKNESESARLAGFGIIDYQKKIYVHKDEYTKAEKLIKSIL